jgi:hypothetical protein
MTKYAVLISGDSAESGFDEFWNDVVLMREMLLANNFEEQNIFILYADGNDFVDPTRTYARYDPVAINRPPRANRPASFTDYPATKAEVQAVFDGLANGDNTRGIPKMTENDFLFVWTFDHGGATGGHSTLCLWGIDIQDDGFANAVDAIPYRYRVFCMQQCHSGGFIDDLSNDKTVILTACKGDESAWPANNTPTQEDETVNGITYDHGEFNYHLISALLKQAVNGGAPVNADTTGNGLVSMLELFNYVEASDNVGEHPRYDDGPNNIGGDIYIEKEKEVSKMALEHAMWAHGHSMHIEYPDRLNVVWRAGFYIRVEGELGTDNWFHFAIPTPVIVKDNRLRVGSVMLRFKTMSSDAIVRHVHIYDGEKMIATHNNVNLSGDHMFERFDVPGHPDVRWGLGISIGVRFGTEKGKSHRMEFISAGCDFLP